MKSGGLEMRPYIMGYPHTSTSFEARCPLPDPLFVDIMDPESQPFYRMVNAGNALAFGGLGMPAWVQLDCATLPTAMIGFCVHRSKFPEDLWRKLLSYTDAPETYAHYNGWVPVSEYCALSTPTPDTWVGFSLFALLRGMALGTRTKALALACYGAKFQIGMTQYHNSAVRTHTAFGPLEILSASAPPHSHPEDTFLYRLKVPERPVLQKMITEGPSPMTVPHHTLSIEVQPGKTWQKIQKILDSCTSLNLLAPGHVQQEGKTFLTLLPEPAEDSSHLV